MTVAELIERLRAFSPDMEVLTEGCDCIGNASGLKIWRESMGTEEGDEKEYVLITR